MSSHLEDFDFEQYVRRGKKGLSKIQYKHFIECNDCQTKMSKHRELNELLIELSPQKMSVSIYEELVSKLGLKPVKPKRDWYIISIISLFLFIIISITFFSEPLSSKHSSYISELMPQSIQISWEKYSLEPLARAAKKMQGSLPGNEPLVLFIFALIVILVYYLFDSIIIKQRLKVKT